MNPRSVVLVFGILSLACNASRAGAQNYLPVDVGLRWIYTNPNDGRDTMIVVGPTLFQGAPVVEFQYHGVDEGLSNFWSVEPDGGVLLHGFEIPAADWGIRYDPPLHMVRIPVVNGDSWEEMVHLDCTRSQDPCAGDTGSVVYTSSVDGIGPVTVPAGTYTAVAIGLNQPVAAAAARSTPTPRSYSLLGTRRPVAVKGTAAPPGEERHWVLGMGVVDDGWSSLVSFDRITAARAGTWGRLKIAYR